MSYKIEAIERIARRFKHILQEQLPGHFFGVHTTPLAGKGSRFMYLREAEIGEDASNIDVFATAMTGTLHVREVRAKSDNRFWFVMNPARRMRYGIERTKFGAVLHQAVAFMIWLLHIGDQLGGIRLADTENMVMEPKSDPSYHWAVLEWLRTSPEPQPGPMPDEVFEKVASILNARRSCVVWFSDFLDPREVEAIKQLRANNHVVYAVMAYDRVDDFDLPVSGWVTVEDADIGEQRTGLLSSGRRQEIVRKAEKEREERIHKLETFGARVLSVSTDENPISTFIPFAAQERKVRSA